MLGCVGIAVRTCPQQRAHSGRMCSSIACGEQTKELEDLHSRASPFRQQRDVFFSSLVRKACVRLNVPVGLVHVWTGRVVW